MMIVAGAVFAVEEVPPVEAEETHRVEQEAVPEEMVLLHQAGEVLQVVVEAVAQVAVVRAEGDLALCLVRK